MLKHDSYLKLIIFQAVYSKVSNYSLLSRHGRAEKIRALKVDHSTIQIWLYKYLPMIESSMHKIKNIVCNSWRISAAYIKFAGKELPTPISNPI